ncbi:hypothetical protein IQ250_06880 [Pseudanabaenaceae cyanobacterium LEGE 13415]|nr:hypothetical protein [Pseudanabaenaceae cyanobacterium LEGE 13415]
MNEIENLARRDEAGERNFCYINLADANLSHLDLKGLILVVLIYGVWLSLVQWFS